jgi:hypothetical protein
MLFLQRKIQLSDTAGRSFPELTKIRKRPPQMGPLNGKRRPLRIEQGSPVTVKDDRTGYRYPAFLYKRCKKEMYLESNYAQRPGSTLQILLENRGLGAKPCAFPAVIEWRKMLCGFGSLWSYGLGIKSV